MTEAETWRPSKDAKINVRDDEREEAYDARTNLNGSRRENDEQAHAENDIARSAEQTAGGT